MSPYDGTEGWAGSDSSRERAEHEATTGVAGKRQREILHRLAQVGPTGLTWKEVSTALNVHHGSASASLTNLHKAGKIVRTSRKRSRSKVYVLPQFVLDDDHIEAYHPNANPALDRVGVLEDQIARARMALLTESGKTAALKILEES